MDKNLFKIWDFLIALFCNSDFWSPKVKKIRKKKTVGVMHLSIFSPGGGGVGGGGQNNPNPRELDTPKHGMGN